MELNQIKILSEGALPLLAEVYDQLNIGKKIDELVKWDEEECKLSPAQAAKAMILNILTDRKPLYKTQEFYANKDVEKLIGKGITHEDINQFCLGRALSKIYKANPKKVYSSVAATAMDIEKIEVKSIHWDTTSKSFQGEYDAVAKPEGERQPIEITYGHSKDLRPDLKQMKFGMGVTRNKIPLFADVLSGNKDDKKWNGDVIATIKEWMTFVNPAKVIHVADSALVTKDNLLAIKDDEYRFISRLPGTFNLEKELRERATKAEDKWEDIGKLSKNKDAASYKLQSFSEQLEGKRYRFIVCHSDKLDKMKVKTIDKDIETEAEEIRKHIKKNISKDGYNCEIDAKNAVENLLNQVNGKYHKVEYQIIHGERNKKKKVRGRPKKGEKQETEEFYTVDIQILNDDEKISKKKEEAGIFVLISNILDETELSNAETLVEYKEQQSVESTFRLLKDPHYVDKIFLKRPDRIEAFGYIMVIAVMLLNIIEARIRKNLESEETGVELQGKRFTFTPTATAILEVFEYVNVLAVPTGGGFERFIPQGLTENQKRILTLCGVSENIYVRISSALPVEAK